MPDTPKVPQETQPDVVTKTEVPTKPAKEFLESTNSELKLRVTLRSEYENLFNIWKNTELLELEKKQDVMIAEGLKKYFEEWKKDQKPPTSAEIQQLLDQEYETFNVPIDFADEDGEVDRQVFVIRELPQSIEKKFYRQLKGQLLTKAKDLEALTQATVDLPFEDKMKAGLGLLDEGFDVLAEAVSIILNPFGKKKVGGEPVDKVWVQDHIGSDRQWSIVEAQVRVNRLRDFFSKVSMSSQNWTMTTRPNIQALQQLVA